MPEGEKNAHERCVVCGSSDFTSFYKGILQCKACRHVFSDLCFDGEDLFALYTRNYFFGEEYNNYLADRCILKKNFLLRMKVLWRYSDMLRLTLICYNIDI